MDKTSQFQLLSNLLTVGEITSPFLTTLHLGQSVYEVWLDWHELSTEKGVDPMDNMALVESEHRIVGWIGFDMLDANNALSNCMEPIESNMIITSDTPLIEVVSAFYVTRQPFFIVLQETRFIGWVSRKVLNGPTLCLCLLALILEIERLLLQVLKVNPDDSCAILSPKRYEVALKIHSCKGYRLSPEGCPYSAELLECTALSDRIAVVALNENYSDSILDSVYHQQVFLSKTKNATK